MKTRGPSFFSVSANRLDERQLHRDIAALRAYYHSIGYPTPLCTSSHRAPRNRRFAGIHIGIDEGSPTS
jgi:hypothetical protein